MRQDLASCENSWANDRALISVVLKLGSYFNNVYNEDLLEECTPNEVFPMVVEVIMNALDYE
ncbi:hypothetical protein FRC08_018153 [Ceratobasidium sp. 394]|nr:hypothetical protein FRC08_018153 [Ceratobasidium sp. 394]